MSAPDQLLANEANWRTHPGYQMNALDGILKEVGFVQSVIVNLRTSEQWGESRNVETVVDGHARIELALSRGQAEVPVVYVDLTPAEEKLVLGVLDPITGMATTDPEALDRLLREINTGEEVLQELLAGMAEDAGLYLDNEPAEAPEAEIDRAEELLAKWKVKRGDVWRIGEHRLMCGDSTNTEDVGRLMKGETVGLCFTSPPYLQQRDYTKKITDWDELMQGVFANIPANESTQILVNLGLVHREGEWIPYWEGWIEWMRAQGWRRFGWYVWDKGFAARDEGGRLSTSHEWVFHFNKSSCEIIKWIPCETAGRVDYVPAKFSDEDGQYRGKDKLHTRNSHRIPSSIVEVNRGQSRQVNHPAAFPVDLPAYFLQSWPGDVYEPFCGSGSTMVAAQQLGRRCFGMEISEAYCAVILERMAQMGLDPKRDKKEKTRG